MEEIKVGEYVRTKKQGICKIDHINEKAPVNKYWVNPDCDGWCTCVKTTNILKHSFNIIDLIEVGDYVNGVEVIETYLFGEQKRLVMLSDMEYGYGNEMFEEHIKTILTKESYKDNCYEV